MELGIELTVIALLALLGGVIAVRMKQPPVLGLLLVGAITGPHALGWVGNETLLEFCIRIGAFLLLFLIGMEFSLAHFLSSGTRILIITAVKLGLVFLAGQAVALLLGYSPFASLAIGVILSITSTVIFLKILEQKGLSRQKEVPLLVGVLILEDIFGVFALTFFSSFESVADITPLAIVGKLFLSVSIIGAVYLLLLRRTSRLVEWITKYSADETFVFVSIGIAFGLGALAHLIGLSESVGAFLAGNIVASLKNAERFEKPMHPFIFVFTSLFFFSIGGIVDFHAIVRHWPLILALFLVSVIAKFLATGFAAYLLSNTNGKGALFAGVSMVSLGEFSLLLAAEANNLAPSLDLVSITAAIIFLSAIAMSALVTRTDAIYRLVVRTVPRTVRQDLDLSATYLRDVSAHMKLDKLRLRTFRVEWRHMLNNLLGIIFIIALFWLWYHATGFVYLQAATNALFSTISPRVLAALLVLVLIFPTFGFVRNLRKFLIDFSTSLVEAYPREIANSRKLYRNIVLIAALFILSISIPPLFSVLGLHPLWAALSIPCLIILAILFLKSEKAAKEIEAHHRGKKGR